MNSHLLAALTSKVAIGVGAATIAFGSAGAVMATQSIGSSSDDTPAAETTAPLVDEAKTDTAKPEKTKTDEPETDEAKPAPADDAETDAVAEPTFSEQVRALAQDKDREGGIGKDVSELAHERNAERRENHSKSNEHRDDDHGDDEDDD